MSHHTDSCLGCSLCVLVCMHACVSQDFFPCLGLGLRGGGCAKRICHLPKTSVSMTESVPVQCRLYMYVIDEH